MPVFTTTEQAAAVFERLFAILLEDETFTSKMTAANLSLRLTQVKPDYILYLDPSGLKPGDETTPAAITVKMSCDTAHSLWSGKLLMPLALATGKVRIRGSVAKVLEFVPLLQPAFDQYPDIAAEAGLVPA